VAVTFLKNAFIWAIGALLAGFAFLGSCVLDVFIFIGEVVSSAFEWCKVAGGNALKGIGNFFAALAEVAMTIGDVIGAALTNGFVWAKNSCLDMVVSMLGMLENLVAPLNSIASWVGADGINFEGLKSNLNATKDEYVDIPSIADAWKKGLNTFEIEPLADVWSDNFNPEYLNPVDSFNSVMSHFDTFDKGWMQNAYNEGYAWGQGIKTNINDWGSQFQFEDGNLIDFIGWLLGGSGGEGDPSGGTNFEGLLGINPGGTPELDPYNKPSPEELLNGVDDLNKGVGGIGSDTGSIADSMELAEEDLKFLRQIAEKEWKKEFTTANITVDMSNYNTINGESDLDGIVTKLADKLYEEMNSLADGVYA
jgi:hypothetical protein